MSGLGVGGLISGVDTDSIIQKLMDIENKRIDLEAAKKAQLQAKQTAWNRVRDSLAALRSSLDAIRLSSLYRSRAVALTDGSVASVSAASGATITSHTLKVTSLAVAQVQASSFFSTPTEQVGAAYAGALEINGRGLTVAATDSLYSIRDKINGLTGANVSADVVQGGDSGYRLVLTDSKTGTANVLQMPGLASSDPQTVQAAGSLSGSAATVTVQQLALYKQVQSTAVSSTQTFKGSFTIRTNNKAYTIEVSDGATIGTIKDRIQKAVGSDLTVAGALDPVTGQVKLTMALAGGSSSVTGFAITNDTGGLAHALGLDNPDLSAGNVAQQAHLTVNGTDIYSESNTITDPAGLTGLMLTLNNTTAQTVTVSSGVSAGLGFHDIVPAQDAQFSLDGVTYTKSSNTITDVVPGLTITLQKGGTPTATADTTLNVGQDDDKVTAAVQGWVKALNDSVELMKGLTDYNSDTKQAGVLQGDGLARNLQTSLRSMLSNVVPGLPDGLNKLSDIGITTGAYGTSDYGKVLLNSDTLKAKLAQDPDGVARVMGALRKNVALGAYGATVTSSPTDTTDPTKVFSAGDVISGLTDDSRFGSAGGGWQSDPTVTEPLIEITFAQEVSIDQLQLYLPNTKDYPISDGLKDFKIYWRSEHGTFDDNTNDPLVDVKDNTSAIQTFEFRAHTVKAIRLQVLATNNNQPARVLGILANQVTNGAASSMYSYVNSSLGADGTLDTRASTYTDQIKDIDDQIEKMTNLMTQHEQNLRDQFARMEAALAKMRSQGSTLMGQLGSLGGQSGK